MNRPAPRPAWWAPAVLLSTGGLVYAADQLSKAMVQAQLALDQRVAVIGDVVMLWHARNSGAAFSLFQGGTVLFLVVTVFALGMVVYFYRAFRSRSLWVHLILGLVLGGALGNVTDRLRSGFVTDFISVGIGSTRWPTFNIADSAIVVGILSLVVVLSLAERGGQQAAA